MTYVPKHARVPEYEELEHAVRRLQQENRDLLKVIRLLTQFAYPKTSQEVDVLELALRILQG